MHDRPTPTAREYTRTRVNESLIQRLRDNVQRVFVGGQDSIDRVLCCLLARGHVVIEDVPGVGKTVLANSVARSIGGIFNRVQFTPDLLPSDVLGVSVYDANASRFDFKRGPIFANVLLADEVNRTTPRTQAALLESMNERQVTIDGQTRPLPDPFMVIATQNPFDFEGTYPLPESQLDRFLMHISIGYPSRESEAEVLERRPSESELPTLEAVTSPEEVIEAQRAVDDITLDRSLIDYIIALAEATRTHPEVRVGLSPRGTLALSTAARATALLNGRDYATPEDVIDNVHAVVAHRTLLRSAPDGAGTDAARDLLDELLTTVPSPV